MVELLVTMAIFLVITSVVLANYRTYGNNAYFANASEDIVLALRQAQVYGVGAKGSGTSFDLAYGVNFRVGNQIIIFRDSVTVNGKYDAGEAIETITLKSPIGISTLLCGSGGAPCVGFPPQLNITFKRPSPDAIIYDTTSLYTLAQIIITNGLTPAKFSFVTINSSGQISLK